VARDRHLLAELEGPYSSLVPHHRRVDRRMLYDADLKTTCAVVRAGGAVSL